MLRSLLKSFWSAVAGGVLGFGLLWMSIDIVSDSYLRFGGLGQFAKRFIEDRTLPANSWPLIIFAGAFLVFWVVNWHLKQSWAWMLAIVFNIMAALLVFLAGINLAATDWEGVKIGSVLFHRYIIVGLVEIAALLFGLACYDLFRAPVRREYLPYNSKLAQKHEKEQLGNWLNICSRCGRPREADLSQECRYCPSTAQLYDTLTKQNFPIFGDSIIGRNTEAEVKFDPRLYQNPYYKTVSGRHVYIFWEARERKWFMSDLNSLNGTWLNEEKLEVTDGRNNSYPVELRSNDVIRLGGAEFTFAQGKTHYARAF